MRNILNNTKDIFKKVLQKANRLDRALNIVAVINDQQIVKQIIDACNDLNLDDYFLTWVGLCDTDEKELCRNWFNSDLEDMNQHFRYFPCPTSRFTRQNLWTASDWIRQHILLDLIMLYRAHQATAVGVSIIVDD